MYNGGVILNQTQQEIVQSSSINTKFKYQLRDFLERYSLPRVVQIQDKQEFEHHTSQSPSVTASSSYPASSSSSSSHHHQTQILLLYKYIDQYINYIGVPFTFSSSKKQQRVQNATDSSIYFPEGYEGWFSVINKETNKVSAIAYNSMVQLVSEQVYTFLSTTPIIGYIFNTSPNITTKQSGGYIKHKYEAGEVYQLRGVFQDNPRNSNSHSKGINISGKSRRDLSNRYAQLVNINTNQELFVPLVTKGCYYEISTTSSNNNIDKDCIYQLNTLFKYCKLPIMVKLIAGQLPKSLGIKYNYDTFLINNKIQESIMFACLLPTNQSNLTKKDTKQNYQIRLLNYQSKLKMCKTLLGFDSEHKMLQSTCIQQAFVYCKQQYNIFISRARTQSEWHSYQTQLNTLINNHNYNITHSQLSNEQNNVMNKKQFFNIFKKSTTTNNTQISATPITNPSSHQQPTNNNKLKSMDRYKDMSKLIDDTFNINKNQSNPIKKSASFMFTTKPITNIADTILPSTITSSNADLINKSNSLSSIYSMNNNNNNNSYITDRLCSKFHVKSKNIKRVVPSHKSKEQLLTANKKEASSSKQLVHEELSTDNTTDHLHQPTVPKCSMIRDVSEYMSAVDAINKDANLNGSHESLDNDESENIYVEIGENNYMGTSSSRRQLINNEAYYEPIYTTLK